MGDTVSIYEKRNDMDMTTKFTFLNIKFISMYIFGSILPDSFGYSMFEKKSNQCPNKTESRRYNLRFHFFCIFRCIRLNSWGYSRTE